MKIDNDLELVHGASTWESAVILAKKRGRQIASVPPKVCVAVKFNQEFVIAWVGAIETDAGIVIFEWLVTRPANTMRGNILNHRAVEHLMRAGMVYAAAVGKRIVIFNAPRGVRQMAERIGFARATGLEVLMGD